MLRKYSNHRTIKDNIKLGGLTAFSAGMVNVLSLIIFFAFTSNVTGHFAIFAQEIAAGNWFQAAIVCVWILVFFLGNFTSNFLIIYGNDYIGRHLSHAIPILLEIACLVVVGIFLENYYTESLQETEFLISLLLFAMGLQNGLTASISNFSVKTTHLTGLTTDLAILLSMFTKKKFRNDKNLVDRAHLLMAIMFFYVFGGVVIGLFHNYIGNYAFGVVCFVLFIIIIYDYYKLGVVRYYKRRLIDNRVSYTLFQVRHRKKISS